MAFKLCEPAWLQRCTRFDHVVTCMNSLQDNLHQAVRGFTLEEELVVLDVRLRAEGWSRGNAPQMKHCRDPM